MNPSWPRPQAQAAEEAGEARPFSFTASPGESSRFLGAGALARA